LELLKETSDPIEAWKLPKRFYLKLFFVIRVCSLKYSKALSAQQKAAAVAASSCRRTYHIYPMKIAGKEV